MSVSLKQRRRAVQRHRNNGSACLLRHFEGAALEFSHLARLAAGSFGENNGGVAVVDHADHLVDRLNACLHVRAIHIDTVNLFHPQSDERYLADGGFRQQRVRLVQIRQQQQDVKKALVIARENAHPVGRNVLRTLHIHLGSR